MTYRTPTLTIVGTTGEMILGTGSADPDNPGVVAGLMPVGDLVVGLDD